VDPAPWVEKPREHPEQSVNRKCCEFHCHFRDLGFPVKLPNAFPGAPRPSTLTAGRAPMSQATNRPPFRFPLVSGRRQPPSSRPRHAPLHAHSAGRRMTASMPGIGQSGRPWHGERSPIGRSHRHGSAGPRPSSLTAGPLSPLAAVIVTSSFCIAAIHHVCIACGTRLALISNVGLTASIADVPYQNGISASGSRLGALSARSVL
jgi:hypothetical protein